MDTDDLYDDLKNTDLGENIAKLQDTNKKLTNRIETLEADIDKLCKELIKMKRVEETLKKNISELFNTSKTEIERKDKLIATLRRDIDNFIFKRNTNFTDWKFDSNKRTREDVKEVDVSKRPKCELEPKEKVRERAKEKNYRDHRSDSRTQDRIRSRDRFRSHGRHRDQNYDKHRSIRDPKRSTVDAKDDRYSNSKSREKSIKSNSEDKSSVTKSNNKTVDCDSKRSHSERTRRRSDSRSKCQSASSMNLNTELGDNIHNGDRAEIKPDEAGVGKSVTIDIKENGTLKKIETVVPHEKRKTILSFDDYVKVVRSKCSDFGKRIEVDLICNSTQKPILLDTEENLNVGKSNDVVTVQPEQNKVPSITEANIQYEQTVSITTKEERHDINENTSFIIKHDITNGDVSANSNILSSSSENISIIMNNTISNGSFSTRQRRRCARIKLLD